MDVTAPTIVLADIEANVVRVNERFAAYARERGHASRPGYVGWIDVVNPTVQGSSEELPFTAAYLAVPDRIVVIARPPPRGDGHAEVVVAGMVSRLAKLLRSSRVTAGHEAFDRRYVIEATSERLARTLLDARSCDELLALDAYRLAYDDGKMLLLERHGVPDTATLDAMIALVTRLARSTTSAYR